MRSLFGVLFIIALTVVSCTKHTPSYPFAQFDGNRLDSLRNPAWTVSERQVRRYIDSFRLSRRDTNYIDLAVNRYYAARKPYLWITRWGCDEKLDTLVKYLEEAQRHEGVPENRFYLKTITENHQRLKSRNFDAGHSVSRTLAQLEYYLSKSYFRYCAGQRFGYVDAKKVYNHLERKEGNPTKGEAYTILFDTRMEKVNDAFIAYATEMLGRNRIEELLHEVQPRNERFRLLKQALNEPHRNKAERQMLSVNLERSRWRPAEDEARSRNIVVNLPSQELSAYTGQDETLRMKVCIGSEKHKTPQLQSEVSHIELNPYWILPKSIVRNEVLQHVGDTAYFERKRFCIIERETGSRVAAANVTEAMLLSKDYLVRQENGEDNSLGQFIVRFDNPFSIYLHDTNNRKAFSQTRRAVSHGCIRVEKPYELALFLIEDDREKEREAIEETLGEAAELRRKERAEEGETEEVKSRMKRCKVEKGVGVEIVYFTAFPAEGDSVKFYPDIYRFDPVIGKFLNQS